MRVNLITQVANNSGSGGGTMPISLTIRPACGLPGDYEYPTDGTELIRMLRRETDLPAEVLSRFEKNMRALVGAKLLGVELSDSVLKDIGYFID